MGKCSNCGKNFASPHSVECKKSGCTIGGLCNTCAGTPQAKIGTHCPSCGKITTWKK